MNQSSIHDGIPSHLEAPHRWVAITTIPLSELHPAPWNPRTISDDRFQNLCRSIRADPGFLLRRPILATADGTIYAGNMRYRAAQHLGMDAVPAILDDISEQLARERAMRDNAQWGEWEEDDLAILLKGLDEAGSDTSLLGFDDRDLQKLLARLDSGTGLTDPDAVPEAPDEPRTKPGDLWLLGDHRLLCGDSTSLHDVKVVMNGAKAHLMATDPPYLVDYTSKVAEGPTEVPDWDQFKGDEASLAFYVSYLNAALPHLTDRAPIYQWHANTRQSLVDEAWKRCGLLAHQIIIWVKTHGVFTRSHFQWQHEPCLYGWVKGNQPDIRPPAGETTVWHVDQKGEQDGIHPTQKPVELFRRPIKYHTKPGDICYEPFLGSGTCLIAAEELGRRCYAIEKEPAYVDVAVARWEAFTGKTAKLVPAVDLTD